MNLIPARKSIFAPVSHTKHDSSSPSPRNMAYGEKTHDTSITSIYKGSPNVTGESYSYFSRASEIMSLSSKIFLKKSTIKSHEPRKPSIHRNNISGSDNFKLKRMYKKHKKNLTKTRASDLHSSQAESTLVQTPLLFKEYKYRRSEAGDIMIKEDGENQTRRIRTITSLSALTSNIINTRPVDNSRSRRSKKPKTLLGYITGPQQNEFRGSELSVPSIVCGISDEHFMSMATSRTSGSDECLTERKRLRKILKKIFCAIYFVGVMMTFKNKVIVYGALRPLDYLEEFESYQLLNKREKLLPILPNSLFSLIWGLVIMFLLIISALLTPIYISFIDEDDSFFYYTNMFIDVGFGIDVMVNFLSAYHDSENNLVTDFRKIALKYLQMWFWIDLISIIPLNDIIQYIFSTESSFNNVNKIVKFLRFPRLYKLIKIVRLAKLAKMFSNNHTLNQLKKKLNLNTRILKLLKIFINFAFINHLVGCIWFYLAKLDDFGPDTWVERANLLDEDVGAQYIASIYWSFQTLTTVGYGDTAPQTSIERSASSLWMVLGVLIYSFTIGNLSAILLSFGQKDAALKNRLTSFEQFAVKANLPDFLSQKVKRFFEINHKSNAHYSVDPKNIMKSLPANLKTSLLLFSYYDMIQNINFLQINPNLTAALLLHFKVLKLKPRELIYRQDDPSQESIILIVYFILRGSVKFLTENSKGIYSLSEGTYFGEIEIFEGTIRQCFCQSLGSTFLLVCPKKTFLTTLEDFPAIKAQIEKVAKGRKLKMIEKLDRINKVMREEKQNGDNKKTHTVLLKKTEYINKVLLKIPDIDVRFEMRRREERKRLVRPRPHPNFYKSSSFKLTRPMSLGNIKSQDDSFCSPIGKVVFQKSMIDVTSDSPERTNDLFVRKNTSQKETGDETNHLFSSYTRKATNKDLLSPKNTNTNLLSVPYTGKATDHNEALKDLKSLNEMDFLKEEEQPKPKLEKSSNHPSSTILKILNGSDTDDNLIAFGSRYDESGSILLMPKDKKYQTLGRKNENRSLDSTITPKEKAIIFFKKELEPNEEQPIKQKKFKDYFEKAKNMETKTSFAVKVRKNISWLSQKASKAASKVLLAIKQKVSRKPNKIVPIFSFEKSNPLELSEE